MSSEESEKDHSLAHDARLHAIGYSLGLKFHPQIRLDKKRGFQFAASLADRIDPSSAHITDTEWKFYQELSGSANSKLEITINSEQLQIDGAFPSNAQEWYERTYQSILLQFSEEFKPKLLMSASAVIRGTMPVHGDARLFLARHVLNLSDGRVKKLERPVHLLGLRLFLPPLMPATASKKKKSGKSDGNAPLVLDWQVELRVESLLEDPSKLFIELDATWIKPVSWKEELCQELSHGHLATVKEYIDHKLLAFLKMPLGHAGDDSGNETDGGKS